MNNPDGGATDKRKNDEAWARFFAGTDTLGAIADKGYCYITAPQLQQVTGREPRLLAKLDTLNDRPKVFCDHELTIFPVKNGEYVLFQDPHNKTYFRLSDEDLALTPRKYRSKAPLEAYASFPGLHRLNESQALDFALLSSLLHEFTGDTDLHLVIRGRTFSGEFQFDLPQVSHTVQVNSVQIEVDGGYESREAIYLVEAKTGRRQDFNIRSPASNWPNCSTARPKKGSRLCRSRRPMTWTRWSICWHFWIRRKTRKWRAGPASPSTSSSTNGRPTTMPTLPPT